MIVPLKKPYVVGYKFGAKPYPLRIINPDGTVFGWRHGGQDFPGYRKKVYAPFDGKVVWAGKNGSAGKEIRIKRGIHDTRLLHLDAITSTLRVGKYIKKGQFLGYTGYTGFVLPPGKAGAHLHWYYARNGKYVDPMKYIEGKQ